tara:strand:- start:1151 stop:1300 length:150 start_codon:yes stop_codon:yes gene_type:complete
MVCAGMPTNQGQLAVYLTSFKIEPNAVAQETPDVLEDRPAVTMGRLFAF